MSIGDVIAAIEADAFRNATKKRYKEIEKLEQMLTSAGIPFEKFKCYDGWQICYPSNTDRVCSAVQHSHSYGNESDLIEIMGLTTNSATVEGWMFAETVFERISAHYKERNNER